MAICDQLDKSLAALAEIEELIGACTRRRQHDRLARLAARPAPREGLFQSLNCRTRKRRRPGGNLRKQFLPRRSEKSRAAGTADNFCGQRPKIKSLALAAGQKPDRHVQRLQGRDGRLRRGGRRIVVEAAAVDHREPFQPLRQAAKAFQAATDVFASAPRGNCRRRRTGGIDLIVPARNLKRWQVV